MTPITHITPREQALQRENERLTDQVKRQSGTIHVQAVAIQAMTEEIAKLKAEKSGPYFGHYQDALGKIAVLNGEKGHLLEQLAALKAQPVQEPPCVANITVHQSHEWTMNYLSLPVGTHRLYAQHYTYTAPVAQPVQPAPLTLKGEQK